MRMTRAALRAQGSCATPSSERSYQFKNHEAFDSEPLIHEDSDREESSLQSSDAKTTDDEDYGRLALRDITTENYPIASADQAVAEQLPEKKTKKGRGGRGKKKAAVEEVQNEGVVAEEVAGAQPVIEEEKVLQHENNGGQGSLESNIVNETLGHSPESTECALDKSDKQPDLPKTPQELEDSPNLTQAKVHDNREATQDDVSQLQSQSTGSISESVSETPDKRSEQMISKTPKFDPGFHSLPETVAGQDKDVSDDSFVESIKTRSPSKLGNSQPIEEHDSFVEDIITRTPSKGLASPRVEDSMEALDDLEDALEKFSDNLPAIQDLTVESPIRQRKTPGKVATPAHQTKKSTTPQLKDKTNPTPFAQKLTSSATPNKPRERPVPKSIVKERVKEFESRPILPTHRRATSVSLAKKTVSTVPTMPSKSKHVPTKSVPSISTTTNMSFSNSPTKTNLNPVKKRVPSGPLSTSKPAFVPAKSEKPTTKSTFVLPGEAVAAKLKAQREERAKREEEAAERKNKANLKPVAVAGKVSRPSVMPRENKASQARMSVMVKSSTEDKENVAPSRSAVRPAGISVTVAKRRPDATQTSTGTRRATTIAPPAKTASKRTTMLTAPVQRIISTSSTGPSATMKGKEVFDRQRNSREAELKEKKEKEEAAKRARAEAAERGRQASREWAEKQKKRLVEKTAIEIKSAVA